MKKWIVLAVLCLTGMVVQAQQHEALTEKELARFSSLFYTNYQHVKMYICSNLESV